MYMMNYLQDKLMWLYFLTLIINKNTPMAIEEQEKE